MKLMREEVEIMLNKSGERSKSQNHTFDRLGYTLGIIFSKPLLLLLSWLLF
jgi:hypothetical protein